MRSKPLTLALLPAILFLTGCISTWDYPEGPVSSSSKSYTIDFPEGWSYLDGGKTLQSTFDGPLLQVIRVREYDLEDELPYSEETVASDTAIEDLGDILFQEFYKTPGLTGPSLESAGPAQIDSVEGVEITFSFSNDDGLRYRSIARAAIKDQALYVIEYSAPIRHYFERYDDRLPRTIDSFKFATKSK